MLVSLFGRLPNTCLTAIEGNRAGVSPNTQAPELATHLIASGARVATSDGIRHRLRVEDALLVV